MSGRIKVLNPREGKHANDSYGSGPPHLLSKFTFNHKRKKIKMVRVDGEGAEMRHFSFLFFYGTQLFPINSLSYRKVQITYRKKRLGFCKAIYAGHTLFNRITVKINFET